MIEGLELSYYPKYCEPCDLILAKRAHEHFFLGQDEERSERQLEVATTRAREVYDELP